MQEIIDSLDVAAKSYPIKALAFDLNKGESTLRNELTGQPGYKLGLLTALNVMKRTNDLRALDQIEEVFNRVAFELPSCTDPEAVPLMQRLAEISKEFGEHVQAFALALEDGHVNKREAAHCHKELIDLIKACVKLQAYLEQILK